MIIGLQLLHCSGPILNKLAYDYSIWLATWNKIICSRKKKFVVDSCDELLVVMINKNDKYNMLSKNQNWVNEKNRE